MKTLKVISLALILSYSIAAPAEMIKQWVCWGPGWGRGGLAASALNYEANLSPQPGDMDLSLGTDRTRLVPWIEIAASNGVIDFFSSCFPIKNIAGSAGIWAGGASYAFIYIHTENAQPLRLKVSSSQSVYQWLNGHPLKRNGAYSRLELKKGWNRLLIKSLSPSHIRSVKGIMPKNDSPSNWTLSASLEQLNGSSSIPGIKLSTMDPERSNIHECIGILSKLTGPDGASALLTPETWTGKLKLDITCRSGKADNYQKDPTKRYRPRKKHWIYTRRPDKNDRTLSQEELKPLLPRNLVLSVYDFHGKQIYHSKFKLDFNNENSMEIELSLVPDLSSRPGYYNIKMAWLDDKGKIMAYNNYHAFAITGGPVSLHTDAPRKIACVGHWMTNPNNIAPINAKLNWMNKAGITWHQKMSQAWSKWGISHDMKGNVIFNPRKIVDETIALADKLNIRLIGDLTMGYVQTDLKRKGQLMALTADEDDNQKKKSTEITSAQSIRLIPPGAAPLPFYGTPEFDKVLTEYAGKIVSYYKGKINYWCGDNEIDLHSGKGTAAEATVYSAAAALYYKAMKRANPEAIFISASLCRTSNITRELFKCGFADSCNWMDVHAHPCAAPKLTDSTIGNTSREGYGIVKKQSNKPIVYGEVSAPLAHSISGVVGQAQAVPKQVSWALIRPRIKLFSYLVPYSNGANLGFCNIFGDPLPAVCTLNAASHLIDGKVRLKDIKLPGKIQQYRVKDGGGDIILLWSGSPTRIKIPVTKGKVTVLNELGTPVPAKVSGNRLNLVITSTPLYIKRQ